MASAGRDIGAVGAGAVLWAVLWVGGTAAAAGAFPEALPAGAAVTAAAPLAGLILYSVILSVAAGYTAAAVGRGMRPVRWLAGLQLVLGIAIEAAAWSLTPVWYHLVFLLLLVPMTLWGGRLRTSQAGAGRALAM